jgi:hypothetical protein
MPRYKVVLEFDHPGQGMPAQDGSGGTLNDPTHWRWDMYLTEDCSDIVAQVFEYEQVFLSRSEYTNGTK